MMERVPFEPKKLPSNEAAKAYTPKFIYCDPNDKDGAEIKEDFYGSRRKLRIGVLGAGISTIQFLHSLEQSIPLESVDVVVYEKAIDVGGVWLTTRYPGCRSDLPGAAYQFSWRPNIWSEWLPPAAETCEYIQTVARENDFYRFMRFQHEIVRAAWTDEEAKWTLTVNDIANGATLEDKVDIFLELNGPVCGSQITIDGIDKFKGEVLHTAHWDEKIDLSNKKVALLGYGSSGVQIAPEIIRQVSQLYTWFRHRTYVLPPLLPEYAAAGGANFRYTTEQKALLADPNIHFAYRKDLESIFNKRFAASVNGSELSEKGTEAVLGYMQEKLASNPGLFEKLRPDDFDVGCRRITMSHGYLEAITDPKAAVFFEEPNLFTEKGFIDSNGKEYEIDIVIAATGYDQSHLPRYPKTVNGEDMRTKWSSRNTPPSYMSICLEGMPNYFNASSTYASVSGSWYFVAEILGEYIVKIIDKMQLENIVSFKPKTKAVNHFTRHADAFLQRFVQSGPCAAWYKLKNGRPSIWPGNRHQFLKIMKNPRFEDFDMIYEDEGDMFSYFGNGFALYPDGDEKADQAWYFGYPEKEVPLDVLDKLRGIHAEALPGANMRTAE